MLKFLKEIWVWGMRGLLAILILGIIGIVMFLYTSPQFGQKPQGDDLLRIGQSVHYDHDKFVNLSTTTSGDVWEALKTMPAMLFGGEIDPNRPLPTAFDQSNVAHSDSATMVTWYGHSAFLIELQGKRILIDPMLGNVAAPVPFGSRRFAYQSPIPLATIDHIDVVIISHDHYDHLDYPTITLLKDKVGHFITPLGVGSHLKAWGIAPEAITELDWWAETKYMGIRFTACPSRHFSGRGLTDRDATQWASWVLQTGNQKLYFSGDGGYDTHFKAIGERYGPFDLAMLECGQYNKAWSKIHMMPEESVQAGIDLGARLAMPIHWGAFRLAPHGWTEPVTRFVAAADEKKLPYILPVIGQRFELGKDFPKSKWWLEGM